MAAGQFRQVITIQAPPTVSGNQNEYGEIIQANWTNYLTTRASYEPLVGRELYTQYQIAEQIDVRFRIRYQPSKTITSAMRVVYRGATYQIVYEPINPDGKLQELILYCKRV